MTSKPPSDTLPSEVPEASGEIESWLRDATSAPAAARLPAAGEVIGGKYRIEGLLGRGGMGAVFRARHLVSEKAVAIKWMLQPASDEQAQRRFEREARAAGRIDHPNVVDVYDVGQEGDCSYLVMELLRGESLRSRLAGGPIEREEAMSIAISAMRGVAAAHRAGVIHRDLKPDNIFLCQGADAPEREAKVLDFGISSIATKEAAHSTLTQEGTVLGSLAYMSPEQLAEPHDVDVRTDVYAFGVILYEMLTGELPFDGASYSALAIAIATGQPERPSLIQPSIPPELDAIVMRALARARADRYPDIVSLVQALLPFSRSAQPSAEPLASGLRLGSHPGPVGTAIATQRSGTPSTLAEQQVQRRRPSTRIVVALLGSLIALLGLWAVVALRSTGETAVPAPSAGTPLQAVRSPAAGDPQPLGASPALATPAAPPIVAAEAPPTPPAADAQEKKPKPRPARNRNPARSTARPADESVLFSGRK